MSAGSLPGRLDGSHRPLASIASALRRARGGIAIMAALYLASLLAGIVLVHSGNGFALERRDAIVSAAVRDDAASRAEQQGAHGKAALIDFARSLGGAAIPETIGGLTFVLPVGLGAYRGWVGGIVSVDSKHRSRLRTLKPAAYYLVTVLLHVCAFTLADGAGLYLGREFFRRRDVFVGPSWLRLPRQALIDVAWLYVLVVPLFAAATVWEYFFFSFA